MFWKTCLTHAGEILLALGGSWLLGYLWSRWFGNQTDPKQIDEYEDQISALRDRIRIQDQDIKASLIRQDTWNSELSELKEKNEDLTERLYQVDAHYAEYLSPVDQTNIRDKHDFELKLKQDQIAAIQAQKEETSETLKSMDIRLTTLQQASEEGEQAKVKLKSAEDALEQSRILIQKLELELKAQTEQWTKIKLNEENQRKTQEQQQSEAHQHHDHLDAKIKGLESYLEQLEASHTEKENRIQSTQKTLEETRQISKELEGKYISQLQAKEDEIERLKSNNSSSKQSDASKEIELSKALEIARQEAFVLQSKLNEVAKNQNQVNDPVNSQKFQDLQILNQQLTNELGSTRSEIKTLNNKLQQASQFEKTVSDLTIKSKEWEGRWKEAATEAEQFKVAHASLIKDRDGQRQHIAKLEADILHFNTVFKQYEQKEEELTHQLKEHQNNLEQASKSNKEQFQSTQEALNQTASKLSNLQLEYDSYKAEQENELKKFNELQAKFNAVQYLYEESENLKEHQQTILRERDQIIEALQSGLIDHQNQLAEAQKKASIPVHKEAEWDLILKSKEEELKQAQQTITELSQANESKLDKLNELELQLPEMNAHISKMQDQLEALTTQLQEQEKQKITWETKNENLHHELQLSRAQLVELNQLKESQSANLGNWEQLYNESQRVLNLNRQQFSEIEKNTQAMETLVAEWEKKYHLVQHELHDVQHQLSESQHWIDAKAHADEDKDRRLADAENRASEAQLQIQESRSQFHAHHRAMDELEKKYNELNTRFNIVQLQYADTQRIKSHLEADIKKTTDYQAKYQAEIKVWQQRLVDQEAEYQEKIKLLQTQTKPIITETKSKSVLQETKSVSKPKSTPPAKPSPGYVFDAKSASEILAKKVAFNNHQIIEGIGPKIDRLLKSNKVTTWQMLAEMPSREINIILEKGGQKFSLADPKTWPIQAKLAAHGKWTELKAFQEKLKLNQKKAKQKSITKVKPFNPTAAKKALGKDFKFNDLKIIEGIGPKIEQLLKKAKIKTWDELSKTKLDPLRALLKNAGNNFSLSDPKTWPAQAKLAAHGQWRRLKTLQDNLDGGKKPS